MDPISGTSVHSLRTTLIKACAISAALLMITILTITRSDAAFSDSTSNDNIALATGDVVLTDDDGGFAMFNLSGLYATSVATECINVEYSGSLLNAPVVMYGNSTGALDTFLDMTLEIGTGGGYGNCGAFTPTASIYTGTLNSFTTTHVDWSTGLPTFTATANPDDRTFRLTLQVQDDNNAQALSTNAQIIFETQP